MQRTEKYEFKLWERLWFPVLLFLLFPMMPQKDKEVLRHLLSQRVLLALNTGVELGGSTRTELAQACLAHEGGRDHIIKQEC